ncbi:MAG: type 1 glutamine amidotransferase [Thermoflexales bacterium]|nr:type 1 glutamine amidotransferase [Thermoflexales bacterium]MCS7325250.1 type 1 glutamine amidotransferase [Thermoflexales bacterium]MCX7939467.1 type 1 glutamine amidotransferase [Thermoflexales bacterium]MDW8053581.1 type 1 glutamine amidotransferase domain-containing protein [Anaerolineae bacterium]
MRLTNKRIAFLVEEGFEDLEFWAVYLRLKEEGAHVTIVAPKAHATYKSKSGGLSATSELAAESARAADFDAVVVPGGWAPDKLRRYDAVKQLVREAYAQRKIVAMICHAGWVGISAGIVKGHRATGSVAIKDDLENAGATWVDAPALRDGNLVWGRVVADIPDFNRELVRALSD